MNANNPNYTETGLVKMGLSNKREGSFFHLFWSKMKFVRVDQPHNCYSRQPVPVMSAGDGSPVSQVDRDRDGSRRTSAGASGDGTAAAGRGRRFITALRGAQRWKQLKLRGRCRSGKMTRKVKEEKKKKKI